jgi:iron complex transport system substrate-binding protein
VTILSLNPCTDAILAQVADRGQIRGISAYSRDPAQSSMDVALARSLPVSGGTLEEVLVAYPDVVVTGGVVPPDMRDAYARAGLRLEEFGMAGTVATSEAQVRRMAALAGHRERGEALVGRIEAALTAAAPGAGERKVSALVWQAGGMVPGREALVTELLERAGFVSFSAERGMRQADVLPLELVVAKPPEVILVAGKNSGGALSDPGEDRMLSHPVLAGLTGVRRFGFDPKLEWCGGPTIIAAARRLGEVRRALGRGSGA